MDGLLAKTTEGGYNLNHDNIQNENGSKALRASERRGTVPEHIVIEGNYEATWKIFVENPGEKTVDISYSFQGEESAGKVTVSTDQSSVSDGINPTGLTVGEPNRNWHIDNFKSHRLGTINFTSAGIYEINMEIEAKKTNL